MKNRKSKIVSKATAIILVLMLVMGIIPSFPLAMTAYAATSSEFARNVSANLPIVTYAMPLSGASRVYSYSDSSLSSRTTGYYIDSWIDQIVITSISSDGRAVYCTYPSSSASGGFRPRWFSTEDIIGLSFAFTDAYTASSGLSTYRMNGRSSVTSYGSIDRNDASVSLGSHEIGSVTYYPTIYPISSGTYNRIGGVRHKLALVRSATNNMTDVTRNFAGKKIVLKSVENGKYLCADGGLSDIPAACNRDAASSDPASWEAFSVTVTSDGWAGFKAYNGKWLSVCINVSNSPVRAVGNDLLAWECIRIYQRGADYYLRSQANGNWCCVRVDKPNAPVEAFVSVASTWERFNISSFTPAAAQVAVSMAEAAATSYTAKSGYNASAAVKYAEAHYNNYNVPTYNSYKGRGGDCANFVSQCLYAGGLRETDTWHSKAHTYSYDSDAWVNVTKLKNYVTGLGAVFKEYPSASEVSVGDLILTNYDNSDGKYGHITICVAKENGTPIICGHTSDERHTWYNSGRYAVIKM